VLEFGASEANVAISHSSRNSVVTESVVTFLKDIPPFQFLSLSELSELTRSISLEYFPKGSVVLTAGNRAAESLYIVQKGAVKLALRTQVGKELVLDMRCEGELFGVLSLMGGDVRDSMCWPSKTRFVIACPKWK
jgi:CBS domain-containing protein